MRGQAERHHDRREHRALSLLDAAGEEPDDEEGEREREAEGVLARQRREQVASVDGEGGGAKAGHDRFAGAVEMLAYDKILEFDHGFVGGRS